jgi:hypothetical protein
MRDCAFSGVISGNVQAKQIHKISHGSNNDQQTEEMKDIVNTQSTMRTCKQSWARRLLAVLVVGLLASGVWLSSLAQPKAQGPMGQGTQCGMMGSNCMMGQPMGQGMRGGMMCGMMQDMGANCMMTQCTNMNCGSNSMSCPMMQTAQPNAVAAEATYTCPMHPDVSHDKPGKCPKCGMGLVAKH